MIRVVLQSYFASAGGVPGSSEVMRHITDGRFRPRGQWQGAMSSRGHRTGMLGVEPPNDATWAIPGPYGRAL